MMFNKDCYLSLTHLRVVALCSCFHCVLLVVDADFLAGAVQCSLTYLLQCNGCECKQRKVHEVRRCMWNSTVKSKFRLPDERRLALKREAEIVAAARPALIAPSVAARRVYVGSLRLFWRFTSVLLKCNVVSSRYATRVHRSCILEYGDILVFVPERVVSLDYLMLLCSTKRDDGRLMGV